MVPPEDGVEEAWVVVLPEAEEEEPEEAEEEPAPVVVKEEKPVAKKPAPAPVVVEVGSRVMDKTKKGIINVDTLSRNFAAGETVTLEAIKQRVFGFDQKVTYVKVLARGVLDKALTIEADDYSCDAVSKISLAGGTVLRTKKQ